VCWLLVAGQICVTRVGGGVGTEQFSVDLNPQVSWLLPPGEDRIESFPAFSVVEETSVPVPMLNFDGCIVRETLSGGGRLRDGDAIAGGTWLSVCPSDEFPCFTKNR